MLRFIVTHILKTMVQCSLMESTWELLRGNVKPNRGTTLSCIKILLVTSAVLVSVLDTIIREKHDRVGKG